MDNELLSAALSCIGAGVSIIPIDHTTKKPLVRLLPGGKWKPFQSAVADEATVRRWFAAGIQSFAVVCGAVSGGLLIFDFDVPGFCQRWTIAVKEDADGLPIQQTGGGGHQILLRCPSPGGSDKLAWAPDETKETGRTIAIETRGEGGYAVVAPSLHPSGDRYVWLTGNVTQVPMVSQEHADRLLAAARVLDEAPFTRLEQEQHEAKACQAHRNTNRNGQTNVIGAFNDAHAVELLLVRHGYTAGTKGRYVRPGGKSESVSVREGRSCHWSSNDPLNDGRGKGGCGCHDAFDVYTYFEHGGDVNAAVRTAASLMGMTRADAKPSGAAITREPWPDPLPLPPGLPPVLAFDFDLLPAALHGWIKDISDRMQCPPDYCAATAMIVAGALIGRKVAIRPKRHDDWQVVPNLYGAMVGRPSLLKSPAMREVLKFLARLEVDAKTEHAKQTAEHEASALVAEATRKVRKASLTEAVKKGEDAQAIAAEMAKETEEPPTRKRYLVNDTTVEKLGVILAENPNGVLLFLDELISLLRSMEREGHEGDRGFYLTAWAGDSRYTYDRIGRGTLDIEATIVSIVGAIQPGVIADYLRSAVQGGGGDDGMMQRFQVTVWPDAAREWRNVDRYPDASAKATANAALSRLSELTPSMVDAERDNYERDALPFLHFDADGQERFDDWRHDLETQLRSNADHPAVESHLAKYRSLIPSLALILHLLDGGVGPVTGAAVEKAIRWGVYLESHARRLYAGVTDAPAVAARLLAGRIRAGDVPVPFAARDVYRNGWAGLDREVTESAIDVLMSLHWLEERIEPTAGKPRTRYVVNPKIQISHKGELTKVTEDPSGSFVSAPNMGLVKLGDAGIDIDGVDN